MPITERKQFTIYPESVINNQAAKAYQNLKNSKKIKFSVVNQYPWFFNSLLNSSPKSSSKPSSKLYSSSCKISGALIMISKVAVPPSFLSIKDRPLYISEEDLK